MEPNPPETDELAALTRQLDTVLQEAAALSAALKRMRLVRLGLIAGLLVIASATVWKFYSLANHFRSEENMNQLAASAQARLEKRHETYMREVEKLVDHASPVLTEAFYDQAKKDLPDFATALSQERETFADHLKTELTDKLDRHFDRVQAHAGKALKEGFPAINDEERHARLTSNVQIATKRLAKRYYVEPIDNRLNGPDGIYATLDQFPAAPPPAKDAPPLEDQFTAKLMDMLSHRLSRTTTEAH